MAAGINPHLTNSKCQDALAVLTDSVAQLELQNWQLKIALGGLMLLVMVGVFIREVVDERERAAAKGR